jgi:very-short-patch-repair endonuclease
MSLKKRNWIFTCQSAAIIYDIPRISKWSTEVHICNKVYSHPVDNVVLHNTYRNIDYNYVHDIMVDDIYFTLYHLSQHDDLESMVVSIEHCLNKNMISKSGLVSFFDSKSGYRHITKLAAAAKLSDEGSESPLESRIKFAINRAGIPTPIQQYKIEKYRVDMFWPEYNLILEIDGMTKYETKADLIYEKLREDDLREMGYEIVRCYDSDLKTGCFIDKLSKKIEFIIERKAGLRGFWERCSERKTGSGRFFG